MQRPVFWSAVKYGLIISKKDLMIHQLRDNFLNMHGTQNAVSKVPFKHSLRCRKNTTDEIDRLSSTKIETGGEDGNDNFRILKNLKLRKDCHLMSSNIIKICIEALKLSNNGQLFNNFQFKQYNYSRCMQLKTFIVVLFQVR